jgi:thiol-disulfide isomerase/thioredoxin
MNKIIKWLVIPVLLVGTIAGASVLYNNLSKDYAVPNLETNITVKPLVEKTTTVAHITTNSSATAESSASTSLTTTEAQKTSVTDRTTVSTASTSTTNTISATTDTTVKTTATTATTTVTTVATTTATTTTAPKPQTKPFNAPDFTVLDYNGNEVNLSDFAGKPIVLNFWATWCYYCKAEMADFNKAYANHPEVQFLMVNATDGERETIASAKKYVEQNGYDFNVFFDVNSDAVNTYGITGFPTTYFIDKDGNLIARGVGMLDYETLEQGIGMITKK